MLPQLAKRIPNAGLEPDLSSHPDLVRGASKYTGYTSTKVGWFRVDSFPGLARLPVAMQNAVVRASNNSISKNTWKTYGSVKTHLQKCQMKVGHRFTFPMEEPQVVMFVAYLLSTGKLKAASIENLLSALRMMHLSQGFFAPSLRPDVVKLMLTGRGHEDARIARSKPGRLPVTLNVMELIRLTLRNDKRRDEKEKLLIWSVCTLAFTGGFRIGEILSKRARTIDPDFDLQKKDIKLVSRNVGGVARRLLVVTLKCPKETQQNKVSIKVEVFGNSTRYDPVRAYMEYVDKVGVRLESSAAFRLPYSGSAYRHQRFNLDLKKLLQPFLSYGFISGHSFRQGMATLMGRAGFEDHEIQACGRWSSSAFLRYIKLGRLTRARWSDRLAACIE